MRISAWSSDGFSSDLVARARLSRITPLSRQALLLTAMEGFTPEDTACLIGTSESAVSDLVQDALREIEAQTRAKVLIIEDEPIIAMDLETIDIGRASCRERVCQYV